MGYLRAAFPFLLRAIAYIAIGLLLSILIYVKY